MSKGVDRTIFRIELLSVCRGCSLCAMPPFGFWLQVGLCVLSLRIGLWLRVQVDTVIEDRLEHQRPFIYHPSAMSQAKRMFEAYAMHTACSAST
jgi:hypothetical protein